VPARSSQLLFASLLVLSLGSVRAAEPRWPTPEASERARAAQPFPTPEQVNRVPRASVPEIGISRPGLDIEAIANRHLELKAQLARGESNAATLRIFVTLAMPEGSLKALVDQAARAGAVIVLRGLKSQSMRETLASAQALIGTRQVDWQIDPEAFARYAVQHAPTFVLTPAGEISASDQLSCGTRCVPTSFFSVAGDVSLDYALDAINRRHPDAGRHTAPYLAKLRSTR
jgi:conjugal transfer pilus assembly protein TrbC